MTSIITGLNTKELEGGTAAVMHTRAFMLGSRHWLWNGRKSYSAISDRVILRPRSIFEVSDTEVMPSRGGSDANNVSEGYDKLHVVALGVAKELYIDVSGRVGHRSVI